MENAKTNTEAPAVGAIADLQDQNKCFTVTVEYMLECMAILMADHDHLAFPEPPQVPE